MRAEHLRRGEAAEQAAWKTLRARGWKLVARNYRCPLGEIDLICEDGANLVFVEVRYRGDHRFGLAAETVDARKQAKLARAAKHFLRCHLQHCDRPMRFDVVAIQGEAIEWIPDAFQPAW